MTKWCPSAGAAIVAVLLVPGAAMAQATKPAPSAPNAAAKAPDARESNLRAYVELLRSDIRAQKVALITEVMQFTEDEDRKFWPVYREYEAELGRINDERLQNIDTYSRSYTALTDAVADQLVTKALDLEARRAALKQKFYAKLKTTISPRTAARALQVESPILLLLDLQVAASLPIAE